MQLISEKFKKFEKRENYCTFKRKYKNVQDVKIGCVCNYLYVFITLQTQ